MHSGVMHGALEGAPRRHVHRNQERPREIYLGIEIRRKRQGDCNTVIETMLKYAFTAVRASCPCA